jgi:hypothetical protein
MGRPNSPSSDSTQSQPPKILIPYGGFIFEISNADNPGSLKPTVGLIMRANGIDHQALITPYHVARFLFLALEFDPNREPYDDNEYNGFDSVDLSLLENSQVAIWLLEILSRLNRETSDYHDITDGPIADLLRENTWTFRFGEPIEDLIISNRNIDPGLGAQLSSMVNCGGIFTLKLNSISVSDDPDPDIRRSSLRDFLIGLYLSAKAGRFGSSYYLEIAISGDAQEVLQEVDIGRIQRALYASGGMPTCTGCELLVNGILKKLYDNQMAQESGSESDSDPAISGDESNPDSQEEDPDHQSSLESDSSMSGDENLGQQPSGDNHEPPPSGSPSPSSINHAVEPQAKRSRG